MSQPKILHKTARFKRDGVTSGSVPSFSGSDDIGTVLSVSVTREGEEAIFEKPVNGKWVDYDAVNQRDREITTVTVGELSELYWELVRGVNVTLSGGGATYTPGSTVTCKGWFQLIITDDSGATIDTVSRWCKVDINSAENPQTGYNQAVFTIRKLYSAANTGTFANIS
jgi:hypothetical protein